MVKWTDRRNVYGLLFMILRFHRMKMSLEEWNRCWETAEADSRPGNGDLRGGDLRAPSLRITPKHVTAADFRLAASNAGKGAGEDGKDLGADVDLVGPGPAYERLEEDAGLPAVAEGYRTEQVTLRRKCGRSFPTQRGRKRPVRYCRQASPSPAQASPRLWSAVPENAGRLSL